MSDIIKIKEEYLNKLKDNLDLTNVNLKKSELNDKNGKISNEVLIARRGFRLPCFKGLYEMN